MSFRWLVGGIRLRSVQHSCMEVHLKELRIPPLSKGSEWLWIRR